MTIENEKIEYRVREVKRYVVTRFESSEEERDGKRYNSGGCETKGVYDNQEVAHEVAYALCKAEHERLGFAPGDERIIYPAMVPSSGPKFEIPE